MYTGYNEKSEKKKHKGVNQSPNRRRKTNAWLEVEPYTMTTEGARDGAWNRGNQDEEKQNKNALETNDPTHV